jgi:hypothetical protein
MKLCHPQLSKVEDVEAVPTVIKLKLPLKYDSEGTKHVLARVGMLMVMVSPGLYVPVPPWGWIWVKYRRAGADSTLDWYLRFAGIILYILQTEKKHSEMLNVFRNGQTYGFPLPFPFPKGGCRGVSPRYLFKTRLSRPPETFLASASATCDIAGLSKRGTFEPNLLFPNGIL